MTKVIESLLSLPIAAAACSWSVSAGSPLGVRSRRRPWLRANARTDVTHDGGTGIIGTRELTREKATR